MDYEVITITPQRTVNSKWVKQKRMSGNLRMWVHRYRVDGICYHLILDGNHRFVASVKYNMPIRVIIEHDKILTREEFKKELADQLNDDKCYYDATSREVFEI